MEEITCTHLDENVQSKEAHDQNTSTHSGKNFQSKEAAADSDEYVQVREADQPAKEGTRRTIILLIIINLALQVMIIKFEAANQVAHVSAKYHLNCIQSYRIISQVLTAIAPTSSNRILRQKRRIWRIPRMSPFVDQVILGSHTDKEFRRRVWVNPATFFYICSLVAPALQKQKRGGGIPLETRVALSLTRLGTGNYLLGCADLYGMSESLASIIVRDFCTAVLQIIRPLVVPQWNADSLQKIAAAFEAKHDIPFIMGAIDGSHIPIIAPVGEPGPFYNRKGFYSVLLQGIVDVDTIFWDWDFGWAGSLHDFTMFINSKEGMKVMAGHYAPYKLIGDVAYPHRTCMWVPFKGTKETLAPDRAHWNYIQSSTRMVVERSFGMLKGRWRILLRRIEMRLEHLPALVGACICLHNLCVKHKDFVDDAMVEEAKKWLRQQQIHAFGDLKDEGTMRIFDYSKDEVQRVHIDVDEVIRQNSATDLHVNIDRRGHQSAEVGALQAGVTMHRQMATALYHLHLKRDVQLAAGGFFESESSSDGESGVL